MCKRILLLLVVTCLTARAADSIPTEASVRELLTITNVQQMLEQMIPQMDAMMKQATAEALKGQSLPAEAQTMIDQSQADAAAVM